MTSSASSCSLRWLCANGAMPAGSSFAVVSSCALKRGRIRVADINISTSGSRNFQRVDEALKCGDRSRPPVRPARMASLLQSYCRGDGKPFERTARDTARYEEIFLD